MKAFKHMTAFVLALVIAAALAVTAYAASVTVKYRVYVYSDEITFRQYDYSQSTTPSITNLTISATSGLGSGSALYHMKYADGAVAYCIEPGVHSDDSGTYREGSSASWYNLPASVQSGIALAMSLGYPSADYGAASGDRNSSAIINAEKWAATQAIIWELICEYRNAYTYDDWGYSPFYSDDLPDGVDVMFNTNKKKGTPTSDVLKKVKDDPDNPFGSLIKAGGQSYYIDADGKRQLSLINKRAEEGDWGEWADKLPSQFLSKQSLSLVNKQLNLAASDKMAEFDEICSLTNPTVKKSLLKSFADDCDSAAVHLQAAALPRQKYQVILPITSMKDNEVYAPNYKNGETVALVRYPHGGTFEIPILTVNNKQAEARRILGNTPKDAIGINSKVAERLSGADFDGDICPKRSRHRWMRSWNNWHNSRRWRLAMSSGGS